LPAREVRRVEEGEVPEQVVAVQGPFSWMENFTGIISRDVQCGHAPWPSMEWRVGMRRPQHMQR
jgi:hypothetical protein